jgi:penicillin amidase
MRLAALSLIAATLSLGMPTSAQSPASSIQMSGLSQPVEILRDRWGINHIYAQNEADLFFAQGYGPRKTACSSLKCGAARPRAR